MPLANDALAEEYMRYLEGKRILWRRLKKICTKNMYHKTVSFQIQQFLEQGGGIYRKTEHARTKKLAEICGEREWGTLDRGTAKTGDQGREKQIKAVSQSKKYILKNHNESFPPNRKKGKR